MLTLLVIIAGLLVGLARGGQVSNIRGIQVHWWPLILIGLGLQVLADRFDVPAPVSVSVIGSFLVIVAAARNLHIKGVGIALFGSVLNLLVLVANGHVPTRLESLVAVGKVEEGIDPERVLGVGTLGELETDDTRLAFLGDIVPVPLFDDVISFGDLIVMAGVFVIAMNLTLEKRRSGIDVDELLGPAEVVDVRHEVEIDLSDPAPLPPEGDPADNGATAPEAAPRPGSTSDAVPAGERPADDRAELPS